jgi:hypothetical protein
MFAILLFMTVCAGFAMVASAEDATARWQTDAYSQFNRFCIEHFGAEEEPLIYEKFGNELTVSADGSWAHISENSACIAWETNLPARSYVRFGPTKDYGQTSEEADRCFYLHIHYLKGLQPGKTYHCRLVSVDERGNIAASKDMTFKTRRISRAVHLPGKLKGPPYNLERPNTTYVLTEDLTADGTGIQIDAPNVTLDLNGYTLTYDNAQHSEETVSDSAAFGPIVQGADGIRVGYRGRAGSRILNGFVVQGNGGHGEGYQPIASEGCDEIAGVTVVYSGNHITGVYASCADIHHNVVVDRGTEIGNRHQGIDAFNGWGYKKLHHNLIKRARHRGITGKDNSETYNNEIYIDSCATNSIGIFYYQTKNASAHHNRIFATGYHGIGVGTVSGAADINVHSNLVHVEATQPSSRWAEYGAQNNNYCARLTWGGENLDYYDNLFLANGRDGGTARGTWFELAPHARNVVFHENVVKMMYHSASVSKTGLWSGALVTAGKGNPEDSPMIFRDNTLISNYRNISIGDGYDGTGCNARFYNNRLIKLGVRPDYRTVHVGFWQFDAFGHEIYDSIFEGGAGFDQIAFDGTGKRELRVGWTLTVKSAPRATVTIKDQAGQEVFSGQTDATGQLNAPLLHYTETPTGRAYHTPHTVFVAKDGKAGERLVTMNKSQEIRVEL